MLKLTITFFASALTFACLPVFAGDLPDYGSKNFSPAGDTPSYFANESTPISARTADTTESDWSAVDEMAPARPRFESARSSHSNGGRHGRYAVAERSGRQGVNRTGSGHPARAVSWGGARRGSVGLVAGTGSAAKTTGAKHKPSARHASASGGHYTMN